jgi:hypothetical protein
MQGKSSRDYSEDWSTPTSIGIWGGTGADRARLALSLARRIDRAPFWLHVEGPPASLTEPERAALSSLPPNHLFRFDPSELSPETGAGNLATWFAHRDLAPAQSVEGLADFVRLPVFTQQLFEGRSRFSPTRVLVIANSDLLQPFYPSEEGSIRPFLEALNQLAVTGIYTDSSALKPNARDLNYLLRLKDDGMEGEKVVRVLCEQGALPGTPGLFSVGEVHRLEDLLRSIEEGGAPP